LQYLDRIRCRDLPSGWEQPWVDGIEQRDFDWITTVGVGLVVL